MSNIVCSECDENIDIAKFELWSVYDSDGQQTEIDCPYCDKSLLITSECTSWDFEVECTD